MRIRAGITRARPHHVGGRVPAIVLGLVFLTLPPLGYLASAHVRYGVGLAALVLLFGVVSLDLGFVPLLAVPATLLVSRVGGAGSNLSVSDLVLFLALICALVRFRPWESPGTRRLLWLVALYQATTLLTVLDNPYRADVVEWFHEAVLVAGSVVVGYVVGREGRARAAALAYVAGASVIAVWACAWAPLHGFQPASLPLGMQKNYIGDMLAFSVLLAYARPKWLGWQLSRWTVGAAMLGLLGILASQSKQAMISCACGVAVLALRDRRLAKRSKIILWALVPILVFAYLLVSHELASNNRFNSVHQRQTWLHQSLQIWHLSPWLGIGLRWWYTTRVQPPFQPPNAEAEVLTSCGIIGLIGFLALILGAFGVVRSLPHRFGTLALAVLLARFVQGQLDIFWVTAQGSLPWLIIGVCLGVYALERSSSAPPDGLHLDQLDPARVAARSGSA